MFLFYFENGTLSSFFQFEQLKNGRAIFVFRDMFGAEDGRQLGVGEDRKCLRSYSLEVTSCPLRMTLPKVCVFERAKQTNKNYNQQSDLC